MGVEKTSFKAKAVFEAILEAILTLRPPPPGASKIDKTNLNISVKIEAFFETRFEAILNPRGGFGFDCGSILASILEPRARSAVLAKIEPAQ